MPCKSTKLNLAHLLILGSVLAPLSTTAQAPNQDVLQVPPVTATIPQSLLRERRGSPIPFREIPISDPATGRPASAGDIVTLNDGRRVNAGELFAEINTLERWLNERGETLRSGKNRIQIQSIDVEEEMLKRQIDQSPPPLRGSRKVISAKAIDKLKIGRQHAPSLAERDLQSVNRRLESVNANGIIVEDLVIADQKHLLELDNLISQQQSQQQPAHQLMMGSVGQCKPFNRSGSTSRNAKNSLWSVGFTVAMNAKGQHCPQAIKAGKAKELLKTNISKAEWATDFRADAKVFGSGGRVLHVKAVLANDTKADKSSVDVFVRTLKGAELWTYSKSSSSAWSKSQTPSKSLAYSARIPFFEIGPFGVGLTLGTKGIAQARLALGGNGLAIYGFIDPYVNLDTYGEISSKLLLEAGVGGQVKLVKLDASNFAVAGVAWMNKISGIVRFYSDAEVEALKGKVYAYVRTPEIAFIPSKTIQEDIFKWTGVKWEGVFIDKTWNTNLF